MAGRSYETPRYSKGRVDRAGERIGTPDQSEEDLEVLENWRAAHANILNTFKTLLYNRARHFNVQIAQRLKRRPTIIDKLTREPDMHLSRMHDIAGCRVIFSDMKELHAFREEMHAARFDHKRRGVEDDRWNYIDRPKDSGYAEFTMSTLTTSNRRRVALKSSLGTACWWRSNIELGCSMLGRRLWSSPV